MNDFPLPPSQAPSDGNRQMMLVAYIFFGLGLFTGGLMTLIGLILAYVKRSDWSGTFLQSHANWLIRSFWLSVLWCILSFILTFVGIGFIGFFIVAVWYIYRIVKGIVKFVESKPVGSA